MEKEANILHGVTFVYQCLSCGHREEILGGEPRWDEQTGWHHIWISDKGFMGTPPIVSRWHEWCNLSSTSRGVMLFVKEIKDNRRWRVENGKVILEV